MVTKYRSVLAAPGALRVWVSALFGRLPQGMSSLLILLLVRAATHSYAAAGVAVGAYALAGASCAPLVGRLVDRVGRARVLVPFSVLQAAAYVTLAVAGSARAAAPVLIVISAVCGALLPPIAPTVRALLREVFEDHAVRETAYALDSILQELVWIAGPLIVAILVALISPSGAIVALGLVCMAGTTALVRSPLVRGARPSEHHHGRGSALASPELRAILIPVALTGMGLGAVDVGLPSLALHAGSRPASGVLLALWSVGSMVGGLWYGARTWGSSLATRYRLLLALAVLCIAPLILARSIAAGVFCALLAGVTIAPIFSCQYALVGHAAPPGTETEAFTWVSAALIGGVSAGSAVSGATIGSFGVSAPFVVGCAATAMAATVALTVRGRVQQPA